MTEKVREHKGWPKGKPRGPMAEEQRRTISEVRRAQVVRDRRIKELAAELATLLNEAEK